MERKASFEYYFLKKKGWLATNTDILQNQKRHDDSEISYRKQQMQHPTFLPCILHLVIRESASLGVIERFHAL